MCPSRTMKCQSTGAIGILAPYSSVSTSTTTTVIGRTVRSARERPSPVRRPASYLRMSDLQRCGGPIGSVGSSTNTAWSRDVDDILGTHRVSRRRFMPEASSSLGMGTNPAIAGLGRAQCNSALTLAAALDELAQVV